MQHIIIPASGQSSRFNSYKPKFLFTHPKGNAMFVESIRGVKAEGTVYGVFLKEHYDKYRFKLDEQMAAINRSPFNYTLIDKSESQASTVVQAIEINNLTGPIIIKDCDNSFDIQCPSQGNFVAVANLANTGPVNAVNKSYVKTNNTGHITSIVEKMVISNTFCCGLYGFDDASLFVDTYNKIRTIVSGECYISDVVWAMILDGHIFDTVDVENYEDWGTIEDWRRYCRQFRTLFIDIDGVLIKSACAFHEPFVGSADPMPKNIETINKLYDEGKTHIILTTARSKNHELRTKWELHMKGIRYHQLICGLPHARRTVINDFASTNPYPSAEAINLPREADNLKDYL